MQPSIITSLAPDMNEILFYIYDHMYDLQSIAELKKVYSSIEQQRVETYPWTLRWRLEYAVAEIKHSNPLQCEH